MTKPGDVARSMMMMMMKSVVFFFWPISLARSLSATLPNGCKLAATKKFSCDKGQMNSNQIKKRRRPREEARTRTGC